MGRRLIRRSLAAVRAHPGLALGLPALPLAVSAVAALVVLPVVNLVARGEAANLSPMVLSFVPLLSALVFVTGVAWAGAAWHRRTLLGLAARAALAVPPGRIWACAWRLALLVVGVVWAARWGGWALWSTALALGIPVDRAPFAGQVLLVLGVYTGAAWLGLRAGLALPAQALGRPLDLVGAWRASRPARAPLLGVAALLALLWAIPWFTPWFALLVAFGPLPLAPLAVVAALAWWAGTLLVWSSLGVLHADLAAPS